MMGLRAKLRRLVGGPSQKTETLNLPPEIQGALGRRETERVLQWLQDAMTDRRSVSDLSTLLVAARQAGWSESDLTKLEILAYYYRGEWAQALGRSETFLARGEFDPDLFVIVLYSLNRLARFEEAYQRLSELGERAHFFAGRSDFALAAALVCQAANQLEETRHHLLNAWRLAPDNTLIALNAYATFFELGDMERFEEVQVALDQGHHDLQSTGFSLAVVALAQDRYEEGFRLLEQRYSMREAPRYLNQGLFGLPRWQGESLEGKVLLLSAEQGLGDTIQMARFLPQVADLGTASVFIECQPSAVTLLQYNFPQFEIVVREYGEAPRKAFDLWTGLMSLPFLLGIRTDTVPGGAGYLNIPPEHGEYWRGRVAEITRPHKPSIGLAWSGEPRHSADRRRSIPFEKIAEAIREIDGDFLALQTSVPAVHPANLIDVSEELVTLADTAALIAEMDLVITVDTSIVHLAGAIAKETWLLLPYRYEWRWGLEGETNHWYESVKVLRQPAHGDWDSILSEVFERRLPSRG